MIMTAAHTLMIMNAAHHTNYDDCCTHTLMSMTASNTRMMLTAAHPNDNEYGDDYFTHTTNDNCRTLTNDDGLPHTHL